jgi:hypothetical protein
MFIKIKYAIDFKRNRSSFEDIFFAFEDSNQTLQIIPNLSTLNVELGRTYTFLCRSTDPRVEPEWTYENGTVINPSMFSIQQ